MSEKERKSESSRNASHLKQVLEDDDENMEQDADKKPGSRDYETKHDVAYDTDWEYDEETPLRNWRLGTSLNTLEVTWAQICPLFSTTYVPQPPTVDHVKEVAEICVKNFRDACFEVSAEFTRIALQFERTRPEMSTHDRLRDVKAALARQKTMLGRFPGILKKRVDEFEQKKE